MLGTDQSCVHRSKQEVPWYFSLGSYYCPSSSAIPDQVSRNKSSWYWFTHEMLPVSVHDQIARSDVPNQSRPFMGTETEQRISFIDLGR